MQDALYPYYWRFQLFGWAFFCALYLFSSVALFEGAYSYLILEFLTEWLCQLGASHAIFLLTDTRGWLALRVDLLWIRVIGACMIAGVLCAVPALLLYSVAHPLMPAALQEVTSMLGFGLTPMIVVAAAITYGTRLLFWFLLIWVIYQQKQGALISARQRSLELELHSSQLHQLRQQLRPHFLFNCLNSIRAMIHIDKDQSSQMVDELSHILRYTLHATEERVSLDRELKAVDSYLNLEQVRLGPRLKVTRNIDPAALGFELPPLLLQTLVENAVKHGISQRVEGGLVTLNAQRNQAGLDVQVSNDGELSTHASGLGIGLNNSRQRLQLLYGRDDLFSITQEGGSVVARLHLPEMTAPASSRG